MTTSIFAALHNERSQRKRSSGRSPKIQVVKDSAGRKAPRRGRVQRPGRRFKGLRKGRWWGQRPGRSVATSRVNAVVRSAYVRRISNPKLRIRMLTNYLQNRERAQFEEERHFRSKDGRQLDWKEVSKEVQDRFGSWIAFHTLILSPGDNSVHLDQFVKEVLSSWEKELGHPIDYYWTNHENTDHYHSHVVIPGSQPGSWRNVVLDREDLAELREISNEFVARERMLDRLLDREVEVGFDLRDMHYYDTSVQKDFKMSWYDYWKDQVDVGLQTREQLDKEMRELGLGRVYDLGRPFHSLDQPEKDLTSKLYERPLDRERDPDFDDDTGSDIFSISHHQLRSPGVPQWSGGTVHQEPSLHRGNIDQGPEREDDEEHPGKRRRLDPE